MTALQRFQHLQAFGVVRTPYPDGTLRYKAPKGLLTPALLDAIRDQKAALHALLEAFEERAALAEYCGGLARLAAEQLAWRCVLSEIPEQPFAPGVPVHREGER